MEKTHPADHKSHEESDTDLEVKCIEDETYLKQCRLDAKLERRFADSEMDKERRKERQRSLLNNAPSLIDFESVLARWKTYNQTAADILRFGYDDTLRFFVSIEYASVTWYVSYDNGSLDPRGRYDIEKATPFQVRKDSILEMLQSICTPKKVKKIGLVCPKEFRDVGTVAAGNANNEYITRIEMNVDFTSYEIEEDFNIDSYKTHLISQRTRTVNDLWIAMADVEACEKSRFASQKDDQNEHVIHEVRTVIKEELAPVMPLVETGKLFQQGRKKGSICPFTDLMARVYESHIGLKAKELWDLIPLDKDPGTGLVVQEKMEIEREIIWQAPGGKEKPPLTFKSFKYRFTQIRKKTTKKIPVNLN